MASLDPAKKKALNAALSSTTAAWVACGIEQDSGSGKSAALEGMIGLIDWELHGQVSMLVMRGQFAAGECCVLPGDPLRKRPSFLLFPVGASSGPQRLAEKARKLNIRELALAESTFPEDFLSKVKQTFKKEGIRCTKLEPETDEPS